MIRLIQNNLIIPRGDTGTFSVPVLSSLGESIGVFTILNLKTNTKVFEKQITPSDETLTIEFLHGDTVNLPVGKYAWDIKFYLNPIIADGKLIDGTEVNSYYAAYRLPYCEIRQTGDKLLTADDAPQTTIESDTLNALEAVANEVVIAKNMATQAAESAHTDATYISGYVDNAAASANVATDSATRANSYASNAGASATRASGYATNASDSADAAAASASAASDSAADALRDANSASGSKDDAELAASAAAASALEAKGYADEITGLSATATTLGPTQSATASYNSENGILTIGVPQGNGIQSIVMNNDYTLTINFTNNTSTTTSAIRGATGVGISSISKTSTSGNIDTYTITYTDNNTTTFTVTNGITPLFSIGTVTEGAEATATITGTNANPVLNLTLPTADVSIKADKVIEAINGDFAALDASGNLIDSGHKHSDYITDVQVDDGSTVMNGVATIPKASQTSFGVVKTKSTGGIKIDNSDKTIVIDKASASAVKAGASNFAPIVTSNQDAATFYGLAKAAGDTTQYQSSNVVGVYTDGAKTAIQFMLGVPGLDTNGKVPSSQLPSYVDDVLEYANFAAFPVEGESGKIYVALDTNLTYRWSGSAYVEISQSLALGETSSTAYRGDYGAAAYAHSVTNKGSAFESGLYKITTNSEGHVTAATSVTKSDITNLGIADSDYLSNKADKTDTVLKTTLSRGRKENTTAGGASIAFGVDAEASGYYSVATGLRTAAVSQGAHAEGKQTVAKYIAHAEGENTEANGQWSHSEGVDTVANGAASHAGGDNTIANGHSSFVTGKYNVADSYDNWPFWAANTSYAVGDKIKREQLVNSELTIIGYICKEANNDATFDISHWDFDVNHMNFAVIVGNGNEYEDSTTHETVREGSNAYALDWEGNGYFAGDVYVRANDDSSGGNKLAKVSEVVGKADKVSSAANGNFAALDANGNLTDSGHKHSDYLTEHQSLTGKQDKITASGLLKGDGNGGISTAVAGTDYIASHQDISGKADKVSSPTNGNFAALDANGNLTDSGHKHSDYLTAHQTIPVTDVQVNGSSVVASNVANVPISNDSTFGVVKIDSSNGINITNTGALRTWSANLNIIKPGTNDFRPITPSNQEKSTFYGLAKAAGADMASSNNAVGTYTDAAKAAIQHMIGTDASIAPYESDAIADAAYAIGELFMLNGKLHHATAAIAIGDTLTVGTNCAVVNISEVFSHDVQVNGTSVLNNGVANVPLASTSDVGVVKVDSSEAYGLGIGTGGRLYVITASSAHIKTGGGSYRPIVPSKQHESTFYGLATAAGDTTQSSSSNAIGTYTNSAKTAIQTMLGVENGVTFVETVSSTTPSITGEPNTIYECGEVSTLTIAPPAVGTIDVTFTSGSTATVLTITPPSGVTAVKWPAWFDATALETNTLYELVITNGVRGGVMTWES